MISALALVLFFSSQQDHRIGDWKIVCENDAPATDGLFDRCLMTKNVEGVEVKVIRTAAGAEFTAKLSGCKIATPVDPVIVPQAELAAVDGDKKFIGGQLRAIIGNNRQCPKPGMVLSVGGPEMPQLLAVTFKLRSTGN